VLQRDDVHPGKGMPSIYLTCVKETARASSTLEEVRVATTDII